PRAAVVGGEPNDVLPHHQRFGRAFIAHLVGMPGALPDSDQARRVRVDGRHCYFPCQLGLRFSLNAVGPSLASSVWKIIELSWLSFLYASRKLMPSPSQTLCFVAWTASGALAVMRRGGPRALAARRLPGGAAVTRPLPHARR